MEWNEYLILSSVINVEIVFGKVIEVTSWLQQHTYYVLSALCSSNCYVLYKYCLEQT